MKYTGMEEQGIRDSFKPQAERQVKVRLALEKIVSLENIAPTDEEIEAEYAKMANVYQMDVEKIKGFVSKEDLALDIAVEKAMGIVRDNAVVTAGE